MKKTILIISTIVIIFGCKDVKKQIEKFTFNESKIMWMNSYKHHYELGKKVFTIETFNMYTSDKGTISDTTKKTYIYGKNGLIQREISQSTTEDNSNQIIYIYDSSDSLKAKLTINSKGDTTYWHEYKNFPDGKKEIFTRYLFLDIKSFEEYKNSSGNEKYDTTIFNTEYIYDGKLCKESKEHDKKNQPIRSIEYKYRDGKVNKELHYAFPNSKKTLNKTKYYNYDNNEVNPDYYTLDSRGDTAEKLTNEYVDGKLVLSIMVNDYGKDSLKFFYVNDKKIGDIHYSKRLSRKSYYSYTYYDNGDIKEEKYYPEEIK